MTTVNIHAAKTNLSKLIAEVEAGEEVVICRGDTPVAKLVPVATKTEGLRIPGRHKGKFPLGEDFFEPLPEEHLLPGPRPK